MKRMRTLLPTTTCRVLLCALALPGSATLVPATAAAAAPTAVLIVDPAQPLRIQRQFVERTADASLQGSAQFQAGVNPWAQLLVYALASVVANKTSRALAETAEELVVPTEQAVGSGVALDATGSTRKVQRAEDAAQALRPYVEVLSGTSLHGLLAAGSSELQRAGLQLDDGRQVPPRGLPALRIAPRIVFAADQRSISVETAVGLGGSADNPERAMRVIVHSLPETTNLDISEHWLRDDARALRSTLAALVATAARTGVQALQAVSPATPPGAPAGTPQQTFRFRLAAENLYLRGTLVEADCEQVVVDTLLATRVVVPAATLRDRGLLPARCRSAG
jgi:hypothetical protein